MALVVGEFVVKASVHCEECSVDPTMEKFLFVANSK